MNNNSIFMSICVKEYVLLFTCGNESACRENLLGKTWLSLLYLLKFSE